MNRGERWNNTTLVVRQSKWSPDPTRVLLEAQRDSNVVNLHFLGVCFQETAILEVIVQLLSYRDWAYVYFFQCHTMGLDCSELGNFLSTKQKVTRLTLEESPQILNAVLCHSSFLKIPSLTIRQRQGLTQNQCVNLGTRLANKDTCIQELSLKGTTIRSSALLAPGIAQSFKLETLVLADTLWAVKGSESSYDEWMLQQYLGLADLIVARKGEHGIGAILQLLRSPNSSLKRLDLSRMRLQNEHVVQLAEALTLEHSKLEQLNLAFNEISCEGVIDFAMRLAQMKRLKKLSLKPNPWTEFKAGEALVEGMKRNLSIEYLDSLLLVDQAPLLRYYTVLNRSGRRILQEDDRLVPLGLWPLILERAGKIQYYSTEHENNKEIYSQLNAVFNLLRNGPIFYSQRR